MNTQLLTSTLLVGLLIAGVANAQTCTNTAIAESTPTSGFTFNTGGTATDKATGLMWKRCLEGQTFSDNGTPGNYLDDQCTGSATAMGWQAALNRAQTANTANDSGYNDWRVPNLKELKSTVEYCRVNPAINTEVFPAAPASSIWSSSPAVSDPSYALSVGFFDGYSNWYDRFNYNDGQVRLVRSGQ